MNILVFIFPIVFASILSVCQRSSSQYHTALWYSLIPLIICGLFRWEVGTDWPSYLNIFEGIKKGLDSSYETVWVYLNTIIAYFGDFALFIFVVYFLLFFCILFCYVKYNFAITILFFLCFYRFGVFFTRIDVAAFLFIFLISYKRMNMSFISMFVHKVFIVPPLLFLMNSIKRKTTLLLISFCATLFLFIFSSKINAIIQAEFASTIVTHLDELSGQSVNRFKSFIKLSILLLIAMISYDKTRSGKLNALVIAFLVVTWLGENFLSQGIARLYSLSFPMLYFLVIPWWTTFNINKRIFIVLLFISVFVGWALSPFYHFHFPLKLWFFDYI